MREQLEPIWDGIRAELRREVPDFKFHIWLEPLALAGVSGRMLFVEAPEHIRTWVGDHYLPLIRDAARRGFDPRASVELVDRDWRPDEGGSVGDEPPGVPAAPRLNPRFTFEQFVIGDRNRLAHGAALAVAELPGQAYNPLFIHGRPGLGKTHLLHAIGSYVQRYGPGLSVLYATVEEFTSQFVAAVRSGDTVGFKERFRGVDVLLVDDVQFLAGKAHTREEFFHTFNALRDSGGQLVMTSDSSPQELADLDARLVERFQAGLVVEVESPELAVREAILRTRVRLDDLDRVEEGAIEVLARRVSISVQALEGALIRAVAYASFRGEPLTAELASRVLEQLPRSAAERPTLTRIQEATAQAYGLSAEDMLARDRRAPVAEARQVAMHLARELTDESLPEIGRGFGGRNHATVLHAHRQVARRLGSDREVSGLVSRLRSELTGCP